MATNYSATYDSADTSAVTVDLIVGIGASLFSFVTLIGLVMLYRFIRNKKIV